MTTGNNFTQLPTNLLKQAPIDSSSNISNFITTVKEKKPKMVMSISILFFIIAVLNTISALYTIFKIYFLESITNNSGIASPLINFPILGISPILLSISSLIFLYTALKIKNCSKFSFRFALITLLITIVIFVVQNNYIFNFLGLEKDIKNIFFINLSRDPEFVLYLLITTSLIFSYNKFQSKNISLSKKAKISLILFFLIFTVPSLLLVLYFKTNNSDYGYKKVQSQETFHIYKPVKMLGGRVISTKFEPNTKLGVKQNVVTVSYDSPIDKLSKEGISRIIILKQVGVESNFDLKSFTSKTLNSPIMKEVNLNIAKDQKAYLIEGKVTRTITFITPDNVLIYILAPAKNVPSEELIQFAESLK